MKLTLKQYRLLYNMFTASIEAAAKSGIPIGQEYYDDIDKIRIKLIEAIGRTYKEEEEENGLK